MSSNAASIDTSPAANEATCFPLLDANSGKEITEQDLTEALFHMSEDKSDILGRDIDKSFNIQLVIDEVQDHYIRRALEVSGGKKKQAAELLGLNNYQTLDKRMEKLGIK